MKLLHQETNILLILEEGIPNILVLENKEQFYNLIYELVLQIQGSDGNWFFSISNRDATISKNLDIILDFFNLSYNHRTNLTKLYNNLKSISNDGEYYAEFLEIKQLIADYFLKISNNIHLPLDFDTEFDITNIFKMMDVKFSESEYTLVEKILIYMDIAFELLGIKLFSFVNLLTFLPDESLELFYRDIAYKKYSVLLFENKWDRIKIGEEKIKIYDTDFCEIC